eukprot:jgi/Bigna1/84331/fgenesh1_pg.130_\
MRLRQRVQIAHHPCPFISRKRGFCGKSAKESGEKNDVESEIADARDEDYDRARQTLQESVLPMFVSSAEGIEMLPTTIFHVVFGFVQYVGLAGHQVNMEELREGLVQARRYIIDMFNEDDYEAIERVAATEVADAFRETRRLWEEGKKSSGYTMSYSVESIENALVVSSQVVVDDDNYEERSMFASWYRWAQLNPFLNWMVEPAEVTGRFEIYVLYSNHELRDKINLVQTYIRYQIRNKDGELIDVGQSKAHPVQRLWRFSKDFDSSESADSNADRPWILSALVGPM